MRSGWRALPPAKLPREPLCAAPPSGMASLAQQRLPSAPRCRGASQPPRSLRVHAQSKPLRPKPPQKSAPASLPAGLPMEVTKQLPWDAEFKQWFCENYWQARFPSLHISLPVPSSTYSPRAPPARVYAQQPRAPAAPSIAAAPAHSAAAPFRPIFPAEAPAPRPGRRPVLQGEPHPPGRACRDCLRAGGPLADHRREPRGPGKALGAGARAARCPLTAFSISGAPQTEDSLRLRRRAAEPCAPALILPAPAEGSVHGGGLRVPHRGQLDPRRQRGGPGGPTGL